MKPVLFAAVISLGLVGATGVALAAVPESNGHTYTEALRGTAPPCTRPR
ncbi:MAG: hypothetical protein ACREFU_00315 [Acetobacteraceae bacterium]